MHNPVNTFRAALRQGQNQIGLWVGLADATAAEVVASSGFDWLLFDAEHAPNDVRSILAQLRAVAPYPVHPVVRPVQGDVALIKQYLDIGAQTLLIPMVDTPEQAQLMARAMRYPPEGIRGVGAGLARASRWNRVQGYLDQANEDVCLLVQIETPLALDNLEAIARTEGVDGIFFGPADLSAAMGYRGQPGHPDVQAAIHAGIARVRAAGKFAGVLMADRKIAQGYIDAGAQFVAVGVDTSLLAQSTAALAAEFKNRAEAAPIPSSTPQAY